MLKVFDSDETTVCVEGRNYSVTITESNEGIRVEELDECLGTNDVGDITNPDPYDCDMLLDRIEELSTKIDNFINSYAEDYHGLNSNLSTLEVDVGKLRLDAMAGIDGNQEDITIIRQHNISLLALLEEYDNEFESLTSQVKTLGLGMGELSKRLETLQQGQLEIVEDVMAVEGEQNEFNKWIEAHEGLNNIFEGWADDKIHELDVAISNNIEKITELDTKVKDMCGDACNTAQEIEDLRTENKQFDEWIESVGLKIPENFIRES